MGTIYQASGWTYVGPGNRVREWVTPSGAVVNHAVVLPRTMPKRGTGRFRKAKAALESAGWTLQLSNPKLRYVAVLDLGDAALVRRIRAKALDYPKRATYNRDAATVSGTAVDQTEGDARESDLAAP